MKTITVTLEVYDHTTIEEIEKSIDKAFNDSGIDCTYNVEEQEIFKEEDKNILQESVKEWYLKTFGEEGEMALLAGKSIPSDLSFEKFYQGVQKGEDLFDMLGKESDNAMRDEVLEELANRLGADSNSLYAEWFCSGEEKSLLQENVKDWFVKTYPTDSLGAELHSELSFEQFYEGMKEGKDVYAMLGVRDSFVRECVFGEMAKRLGIDYDEIYDLWMDGPTGNIALGNGKKPKIDVLISSAEKVCGKQNDIKKEAEIDTKTELLGDSLKWGR